MIEETLVSLYNEDDIESVEASLHEVERGERLARNVAVNQVTQLTQQQTNNTSNNLQTEHLSIACKAILQF